MWGDISPRRAGVTGGESDRASVPALVTIYVHIDHVSRISYLLVTGFSGHVLCSEPSARLLQIAFDRGAPLAERGAVGAGEARQTATAQCVVGGI